jgi:chaperonin GroEL (HSP60 family)
MGVNIPFLMVANIHQRGTFMDIARLCNAKTIKKYIDFTIQKHDQESGDAPTMETIHEFYGTADAVVSDYDKTKFINPQSLYKPGTTEFSDEYLQMVDYLKTEMESAKKDGKTLNTIGELKRRYNALKANMVDLYIGGATPEERDNRFDSAEDAVLNCRSAAENGYGYGANVEGFSAVSILRDSSDFANDKIVMAILDVLYNSYLDVMAMLYGSTENLYLDSFKEYEDANSKAVDYVHKVIKNWVPVDVVTKKMSYDIISSIDGDISILDIIAKLMTILINCKQFVCPLPTVSYKQAIELDNGIKAILE